MNVALYLSKNLGGDISRDSQQIVNGGKVRKYDSLRAPLRL